MVQIFNFFFTFRKLIKRRKCQNCLYLAWFNNSISRLIIDVYDVEILPHLPWTTEIILTKMDCFNKNSNFFQSFNRYIARPKYVRGIFSTLFALVWNFVWSGIWLPSFLSYNVWLGFGCQPDNYLCWSSREDRSEIKYEQNFISVFY